VILLPNPAARLPRLLKNAALALLIAAPFVAPLTVTAQTLALDGEIQRSATLASGTTATLTGRAELHLTGTGDPIPGCVIHMNSVDAWVFFDNIVPATVNTTLLSRLRVNGATAVMDTNVRVVEYGSGTVVIPHPSDFRPLQVFTGTGLTGPSIKLSPYTAYTDAVLGSFANKIRSFTLKRGYTLTIAQNDNGTGVSRNYVAQDGDLEVSLLPTALDGTISFVRIFPWRWISKKGSCDVDPVALNARWHYNWNISLNSTANWEYVAIKQQPYWPGTDQNWKTRGVNHILHFNEPNNPVEDAYKNLTPVGSATDAVARLPELLGTGLRLGAPAVTDGGYSWIVDYINQAEAAGHRVDFVPIHYYRSYANNGNAAGAATNLYNFLKGIYDVVKRPIWVTEFNNGANWTTDADPTFDQNKNVIEAMVNMMDSTPWIERYSVYSAVEEVRQVYYNAGGFTPMGAMYRDHVSPLSYLQALPDPGRSTGTELLFETNTRDTSGGGNNAMAVGTPKLVTGKEGQGISFDGTDDWLDLPPRIGDSTDFTFAGWVKWNGGTNWQRIFDLGLGTANYLFLSPSNGTNLRFAIKDGGAEQILNGPALPVGTWTHVAVTLNGNTGKLYVNGAVVDTQTITLNPVDVETITNYIGKSQFPGDPLFNGTLDSIRFLGNALTDAQISDLASAAPLQFTADPIALPVAPATALPHQSFTASLSAMASAGTGTRNFTKLAGPAWLSVSPDGSLTGVPGLADRGMNEFTIRVSDSKGAADSTTLRINVADAPGAAVRYPFDGNANSTSGLANGVAAGAAAYGAGKIGNALYLNGTDASVTLPAGTASADEITISTWYYANTTTTWQRLLDVGAGTDAYMFITPRSGGTAKLRFAIKNGGAEQTLNVNPPATGTWHHVAVTLGGGTGRLYLNGALVDTQPITIKPSDFPHLVNYVGRSQFAADPLFNGRVDELQIYHQVLDATQVAALANINNHAPAFTSSPIAGAAATIGESYDQSIASTATDADAGTTLVFSKLAGPAWLTVAADGRISGVPGQGDAGSNKFVVRATDPTLLIADAVLNIAVATPADLLAHYSFNSSLANNLGGTPATLTGAATYTAAPFDNAITLDGTTASLQLPAAPVNALTDFTIAARVRWNGGANWQRLFDFGNGTTQYLFITPASGAGNLRFAITSSGNGAEQRLDAPTALPIGDWAHVAVAVSGTTGTLYLNGTAVATGVITLDPVNFAPAVNYIGKAQFAADPLFNGSIDDFRIYGRGLSASEVAALAVPPPAIIVPPVVVPVPGYATWAGAITFPPGESGPTADPDNDGVPNAWEFLLGGDPLLSDSTILPKAGWKTAAELGIDGDWVFLATSARVRKQRAGTEITALGAASVEGLSAPDAAEHAFQAGTPVDDGEYEILTWFYEIPTGLAEGLPGFLQLRAVTD